MYAVIFKADVNILDQQYTQMVEDLRRMAMEQYGCIEIVSTTEANKEITVSYWHSLEDIKKWKGDDLHLKAQRLGREKWYKSYEIQVVQVLYDYRHGTP